MPPREGSGGVRRAGLRRARGRACPGRRASRPEARQRAVVARGTEDHRLRSGEARLEHEPRDHVDHAGRGDGHSRLHVPGTGRGRDRRREDGPLVGGRDALRAAHGAPALPGGQRSGRAGRDQGPRAAPLELRLPGTLPWEAIRILRKLLAKQKVERYQHADEVSVRACTTRACRRSGRGCG